MFERSSGERGPATAGQRGTGEAFSLHVTCSRKDRARRETSSQDMADQLAQETLLFKHGGGRKKFPKKRNKMEIGPCGHVDVGCDISVGHSLFQEAFRRHGIWDQQQRV